MSKKRGWDQYADPAQLDELGLGNSGADTYYDRRTHSALYSRSRSSSPHPVPGAWTPDPVMPGEGPISTRPVRGFTTFAEFIPDVIKRFGKNAFKIFHRVPEGQGGLAQRIRPEPVYPHSGASKRILLDDGLDSPDSASDIASEIPGAWSPARFAHRFSQDESHDHTIKHEEQESTPATPTTHHSTPSPLDLSEPASPAGNSLDGTQTQDAPTQATVSEVDNAANGGADIVQTHGRSHVGKAPSKSVKTAAERRARRQHNAPYALDILASTDRRRAAIISERIRMVNNARDEKEKRSRLDTMSRQARYNKFIYGTTEKPKSIKLEYSTLTMPGAPGKIATPTKEERVAHLKAQQEAELQSRLDAQAEKAAMETPKWDEFGMPTPEDSGDEARDHKIVDAATPTIPPEDDNHLVGPKKSVSFKEEARLRPFFQDDAVDDILESFLADVESTPVKVENRVAPNELSVSAEALEEMRKDAISPAKATPKQEVKEEKPILVADIGPLLPPISPKDLAIVDDVAQISNGGRIQRELGMGKVNTHDMKTLLPEQFGGAQHGWLNDNVINGYLEILADNEKTKASYKHRPNGPAPPVHALPSQWYVNARRDIKSIARWAKKKNCGGKNLLDMKLMLLPVCEGDHWRLVAVKPQERTIEYLDSLGWNGAAIIQTAKAWVKQELGDLWSEEEWTITTHQRSGRQLNGSDCGVFTCLNALALVKGADPASAEITDGMHPARVHIAHTVLCSRLHGG